MIHLIKKHIPLDYLGFNIIWCLSSFTVSLIISEFVFDLHWKYSIGIGLYTYIMDLVNSCKHDAHEDRIKELEEIVKSSKE